METQLQPLPILDAIKTSCKSCKWAIYDGNTQTGCLAGQIDKFKEWNPDLVVEAYDEEKEFYVIRRFCNLNKGPEFEGTVEDARKSIALKMTVVVECMDVDGASKTAWSLLGSSILPHQVFFVDRTGSPARLHLALKDAIGNTLTWRMVNPIDDKTIEESINLLMEKVEGGFLTVWKSGDEFPPTLISSLDFLINDHLFQICLLEPNEKGSGLTIQTALLKHSLYGKMDGILLSIPEDGGPNLLATNYGTVVDKVKWLAKKMGRPDMIRKLEDVC